MSRRGLGRCALAAVLFGATTPAASQLAAELGAFLLAGLLYLGAGLASIPSLRHGLPSKRSVAKSWRGLATAVVLGGAVGPVLLAAGLLHTPAATASLLLNLELVFTAVLAALVFREHLGRPVVFGTACVVTGGVLLGWSGDADLRWGALLIAAACLCWAVDNCVTAGLDEFAPAHITLVKGFIAGTANLVLGLVAGDGQRLEPDVVLAALAIGAVGYGLSITFWVQGARDLGAARAQLVFSTAPFVGAIVSWVFFDEPVLAVQLLALGLAAIGIAAVTRSDHGHRHEHAAAEHDHEHRHDDEHHSGPEHSGGLAAVRHQHPHEHRPTIHTHPHVPDVHHRHQHRE
jgi:drug/metabolite transporter (DMT)-like permease